MHFDWFDSAHHKYAQCKQKGLAPILIVVLVVALVGLVLFVPFPYYRNAYCNEMSPPGCYPAGWKLKTPLWQEILGIPSQTVSYTLIQPSLGPADASPIPNGTEKTANWKTYTSEKYGISFKYPDDWVINERDVETDFVVTVNSPDEHHTNGVLDKGYNVYINYRAKAGRSLDDLEKLNKENPDPRGKEFTRTMLNGKEALKFLFQPSGTAIRFEYILVVFGHEVQFWCYYALTDTNGRSQCETIGSTLNILK